MTHRDYLIKKDNKKRHPKVPFWKSVRFTYTAFAWSAALPT